jgi:hypothetical protein
MWFGFGLTVKRDGAYMTMDVCGWSVTQQYFQTTYRIKCNSRKVDPGKEMFDVGVTLLKNYQNRTVCSRQRSKLVLNVG